MALVTGFMEDLAKARKSENFCCEILNKVFKKGKVENVSNIKKYRHRGDLRIVNNDGDKKYIDVKNDSCIYKTGNFLAEHLINFYETDSQSLGFMRVAQYDYIAYVSEQDKIIYILNFDKWKSCYKEIGTYRKMNHKYQSTIAYLCPKDKMIEYGVILYEIHYDFTEDEYFPVKVDEIA